MRETIMGRELFDYAFKEYARRWAFKHPTPADFFRTMEDASGIDLDWFVRGWFYTTDYNDISIENVIEAVPSTGNPEVEKPFAKAKAMGGEREDIGIIRNRTEIKQTATEANPELNDFYNSYDPFAATKTDKENYQRYLATLSDDEKKIIEGNNFFYQIDFKNHGELVMPIIVEFEFEDGSRELHRIPAEIWRKNDKEVSKIFKTGKRIKQIYLDPFQETADINMENNFFPRKPQPSRFEIFKQRQVGRGAPTGAENPMQRARRENGTAPNGGKE
jgi:aminopeptidase N